MYDRESICLRGNNLNNPCCYILCYEINWAGSSVRLERSTDKLYKNLEIERSGVQISSGPYMFRVLRFEFWVRCFGF